MSSDQRKNVFKNVSLNAREAAREIDLLLEKDNPTQQEFDELTKRFSTRETPIQPSPAG